MQTNLFLFCDGNIVRKIQLENILYLEAMGDYVKLYTSPKMYAIHTTMKAMEERLSKDMFLRISIDRISYPLLK